MLSKGLRHEKSRENTRAWTVRDRGFRKVGVWVPPKPTELSNFPEASWLVNADSGFRDFWPRLKISSLWTSLPSR